MLALVLMFCACVTLSSACSCARMYGPARLCRYDLVVRGVAMAEYEEREEPLDPRDPLSVYSPFSDMVYTIKVTQEIKVPESFKGSDMIRLRTPVQGSMCGTRLALDTDGVFFARVDNEGQLLTGLCDPNVAWQALEEDEQTLVSQHFMEFCANSTTGPPGTRL